MKRPKFKRVVVPGVSIWPQPKKSPRARYRITYGPKSNRKTVIASTDMETTIELAMKLSKEREQRRLGSVTPDGHRHVEEDRRPIKLHLEEWRDSMKHDGSTPKHVAQFHSYASALLIDAAAADKDAHRGRGRARACTLPAAGWRHVSEIVPSKIRGRVASVKQQTSGATANRYLDAANAFLTWGVADGRWPRNVCEHLDRYRTSDDRQVVRRAISAKDFAAIVQAAADGPERWGMTGAERSLAYRAVCACGLRADEARRIPVSEWILEGADPGVWVPAGISKNRKRQFVRLPVELADELAAHAAGRPAGGPLFDLPRSGNTAKMIRADVEAAGLPYESDDGVFDFHALRHECGYLLITEMARRGQLNVKAVQLHMRHASIRMTLDTYGHLLPEDQQTTRESLRSFTSDDRKTLAGHAPVKPGGIVTPSENDVPEKAQRNAQRQTGSNLRPSSSNFTPTENPMPQNVQKPAEKRVSGEWSDGESNPDLLNAIQPSQFQKPTPRKDFTHARPQAKAQRAAPTQPPHRRPSYVRSRGRIMPRVPRPVNRPVAEATEAIVSQMLAAATRERADAGVPEPR